MVREVESIIRSPSRLRLGVNHRGFRSVYFLTTVAIIIITVSHIIGTASASGFGHHDDDTLLSEVLRASGCESASTGEFSQRQAQAEAGISGATAGTVCSVIATATVMMNFSHDELQS